MTDFAEEKAYAKLNISLDVRGKRDDGYHDMVMVMQTVSLSDTVKISPSDKAGIHARCNIPFIPTDERNLAVKAAMLFCSRAGVKDPSLDIDIRKEIPVGAGLAGGSSDAAAVLRGLNRLFLYPLSAEQLMALAGDTGSDVPFCLAGGTMLATGRGEILEKLPAMPPCLYVICKPSFSVSTPELFRKLDSVKLKRHPDTAGIREALEAGDLRGISRRMYNVFEDCRDRRLRTVTEMKSVLLDCNALGAVMTGTGSAVFGIFEDRTEAEKAAAELRNKCGFACVAESVQTMLDTYGT